MMDLSMDEKMLMLLYSPGTRMGLYGALQQMKEQLEEDGACLSGSVRGDSGISAGKYRNQPCQRVLGRFQKADPRHRCR